MGEWRSRNDTTLSGLLASASTSVRLSGPSTGDHTAWWRRPDAVRRRVERCPANRGAAAGVDEVLADVPDTAGLRHGRWTKSPVEVIVKLGVRRRAGTRATAVVVIPVGACYFRVPRHHLHSRTQFTLSSFDIRLYRLLIFIFPSADWNLTLANQTIPLLPSKRLTSSLDRWNNVLLAQLAELFI